MCQLAFEDRESFSCSSPASLSPFIIHGYESIRLSILVLLCTGGTFLSFVRDVDEYMVEELRNPSYHLELISAEPSGFRCQIAFGNPHLRPPKPRKACISCDQENAISQVSKIGSSELNNVWLDGKGESDGPCPDPPGIGLIHAFFPLLLCHASPPIGDSFHSLDWMPVSLSDWTSASSRQHTFHRDSETSFGGSG